MRLADKPEVRIKSEAVAGRKLKLAILGTRGIPASYGGFETFAEELSTRLVQLGHSVTVYCRSHAVERVGDTYKGVRLRHLPTIQHKYLDTPVHTALSLLDLYRRDFDVVLVCNAANSPFFFISKLLKVPLAVNVDGIERMRGKWNLLGKSWYRLGEFCSVKLADVVIADAKCIEEYYRQNWSCPASVISYGFRECSDEIIQQKQGILGLSAPIPPQATTLFEELGVKPQNYILYVSRLEPENNAHRVVESFNLLPAELREKFTLVVVGDAPYSSEYKRRVYDLAGPGVIFAGYRFGADYEILQKYAYLYVQATEVGGTHPALVEAMGFANCIIANDTPEHREVLAEAGLYYSKNNSEDLAWILKSILERPELVMNFRKLAYSRVQQEYSWDKVVRDYEKLFSSMAGQNPSTPQILAESEVLQRSANS